MPNAHTINYVPGFTAGESLTSSQYHMVFQSADNAVSEADSAGNATGLIQGILLNAPASGEPAEIAGDGSLGVYAKVLGNSVNISRGDKLKADVSGSGKLIKTTTDTDDYHCIAREASTADNDLIRVDVNFGMVAG